MLLLTGSSERGPFQYCLQFLDFLSQRPYTLFAVGKKNQFHFFLISLAIRILWSSYFVTQDLQSPGTSLERLAVA